MLAHGHHTSIRYDGQPTNEVGFKAEAIEIFATLFTIEAWHCWYNLLDPIVNDAGWGYDYTIYDFCKKRLPSFEMGVVYSMVVKHHEHLGRVEVSTVNDCPQLEPPDKEKRWLQMNEFIQNITFVRGSFDYIGPPLV